MACVSRLVRLPAAWQEAEAQVEAAFHEAETAASRPKTAGGSDAHGLTAGGGWPQQQHQWPQQQHQWPQQQLSGDADVLTLHSSGLPPHEAQPAATSSTPFSTYDLHAPAYDRSKLKTGIVRCQEN